MADYHIMADYDWHCFDAVLGYEVRSTDDGRFEVRREGEENRILTEEEFLRWRQPYAPNPQGLE